MTTPRRDTTDRHAASASATSFGARSVAAPGSRGRTDGSREADGHGHTDSSREAGGRRRRAGGLHRPEPVAVVWNERQRRPAAFIWRGRRHRIARVVERWIVETGWWNDDTHVSRSYNRVEADGRLFDLCYDRLAKSWSLERALN